MVDGSGGQRASLLRKVYYEDRSVILAQLDAIYHRLCSI